MKNLLIILSLTFSFSVFADSRLGERTAADCMSGNQASRFQEDVRPEVRDNGEAREANAGDV